MPANIREITALCAALDKYDVPRHPDVTKAIAAAELVQAASREVRAPAARLLDLGPDQLRDRLTETITRQDTGTAGAAAAGMLWQLDGEASAAMADHAPTIIAALRPTFAKAAKAVTAATETGLRPNMTADDVIDLVSVQAITAWRSLPKHLGTLQDIAELRIRLSELFGVPPQSTSAERANGDRVDYTTCFTHPDLGNFGGYGTHATEQRWLALAIATGGRLRLNDPEETVRTLYGEGTSPGWIVAGSSCVVTDAAGHQLMLYSGDWIPTWVDAAQVDRIVDSGLLSPARADAIRPPDKHPHGMQAKVKVS